MTILKDKIEYNFLNEEFIKKNDKKYKFIIDNKLKSLPDLNELSKMKFFKTKKLTLKIISLDNNLDFNKMFEHSKISDFSEIPIKKKFANQKKYFPKLPFIFVNGKKNINQS